MENNLKAEFNKRKPWVTKFVIEGKAYGGKYDAFNDQRLSWFIQRFPEAETILELGSLEGGHTFALAQHPNIKRIVAIESRGANLERARFVQQLLKIDKAEFILANLEDFDLASVGKFEVVFCAGLLYHLPEPWRLLEQVARVSPALFLWTHYAPLQKAKETRLHYAGMTYREGGMQDSLSGMSPVSFWPTLEGLQQMLADYSFTRVEIIQDEVNHPHGPAVTLAAHKS